MKKDWISLTAHDMAKITKQVDYISWEPGAELLGPVWVVLKNGTRLAYQQSRFNSSQAKWFEQSTAKLIASSLEVPLKTT